LYNLLHLGHLVHGFAQSSYAAVGIILVNDSFSGCPVQNRIRPLQGLSGLLKVIGLNSAAYGLDRVFDMAFNYSIPGPSLETLSMTLQSLLRICQAALPPALEICL
jgi:hypothetical protein